MLLSKDERYTYADYCSWPDDVRCELIDGVVYDMSVSPLRVHQEIRGQLGLQIGNYLDGKACEVYFVPLDVVLNKHTVVQPDITVICDPKKLTKKGCTGAPDMIIEILSPGNRAHDKLRKFNAYRAAGVREYWIVDPSGQTVDVHLLDGKRYVTEMYGPEDSVPVTVLDDLAIDMKKVFPQPPDAEEDS